jgi:hypothetical protein
MYNIVSMHTMTSIRINTMTRLLPRKFSSYRPGQYSRMMDMGGVPQTKSSIKLNFGQKNKIQAIALDFNLITRAVDEARSEGVTVGSSSNATTSNPGTSSGAPWLSSSATSFFGKSSGVMPNVGLVQDIANLLKVKIGEEETSKTISVDEPDEATLARLFTKSSNDDDKMTISTETSESISSSNIKKPPLIPTTTSNLLPSAITDIRSKYASKLQKKIDGGASSLDRQKEEKLLNRGDASLHLAARAIATNKNNPNNTSTGPTRWLAASGTSKLLSFISSRSMKIALLPIPRSQHADSAQKVPKEEEETSNNTGKAMEELSHQLPHVQFHLLIKSGEGKDLANVIVRQVQDAMSKDHGILPINTLIVSDRDDYLREGRDMGFYTCRIRPNNLRRGNVTTNFTTETIAEVEDVINELNGLSMNSVLTGSGS